jgi:hypothetical protein
MRNRQRGGILPVFVISLLALVGIAALAIDSGHGFLNRARLQNALDAAALAGAKMLDDTGSTIAAAGAADIAFNATAKSPGNEELEEALADMEVSVNFSTTLVPFVPGPTGPYVRVRAEDFSIGNWFAGAFGMKEFEISGSAVAGPSPSLVRLCNVAPMMACGDPADQPLPGGTNFFGYDRGDVQMLKLAANDSSAVGPGNFQLIRLDGLTGGSDIRAAMGGSMNACIKPGETADIDTEPGNKVGPAVQGINTRLGIYNGPVSADQYPPDWVTTHFTYNETDYNNNTEPGFDLDDYTTAVAQAALSPPAVGVPGRRILRIPIGDCTGLANGASQVALLGVGCFFLIDEARQQGNEAQIFGQFKDGCGGMGTPGPNPGTGIGPHIIQLYQDPDSLDS